MKQNFNLAKKIAKNVHDDYQEELEDINLWPLFGSLYKTYTIEVANTLIAFVIFAYDNDSAWLNFNQDRHDNKVKIISSIGADPTAEVFEKKLNNLDEIFNDIIAQYLQSQVTYKWMMALTYLDYSAEMLFHARKKPAPDKITQFADKEGNINMEFVKEWRDHIHNVDHVLKTDTHFLFTETIQDAEIIEDVVEETHL